MNRETNLQKASYDVNRLFRVHERSLKSKIENMVTDTDAGEEIYQELYLLLRQKPVPPGIQTPLGYVLQIVSQLIAHKNRARSMYEKLLVRVEKDVRNQHERFASSPVQLLKDTEHHRFIMELIDAKLYPREAEVIIERYFKQNTLEKIAKKTRLAKQSVSRYLHSGMKKLRSQAQNSAELRELLTD